MKRSETFGRWQALEFDPGIDGGAASLWGEAGEGRSCSIAFLDYERTVALQLYDDPDDQGNDAPLCIQIPRWERGLIQGAVLGVCAMAGLKSPPPMAAIETLAVWLGWPEGL